MLDLPCSAGRTAARAFVKFLILIVSLTVINSTANASDGKIEAVAVPPKSQNNRVSSFTLQDGLRVVVVEDHRSPLVINSVWYRVGAADEVAGETGISHTLEHMMFRGSARVAPGQFRTAIADVGGSENAVTTQGYTMYYEAVDKRWLQLAMNLESDRMFNLSLSGSEFSLERQVVLEEVRTADDDAEYRVYRALLQASLSDSGNRRLPGGDIADVESLSAGALRNWYRQWYCPHNAVLVVGGDVDAMTVRAQAQRAFGSVPASASKCQEEQSHPSVIVQPETSRAVGALDTSNQPPSPGRPGYVTQYTADGQQYLLMGYRLPAMDPATSATMLPSLMVLREVLAGYDGARLSDTLVRQQGITDSVDVSYDGMTRGPQLFLISAAPSSGHTVAELEQSIRAQVALIRSQGISPSELQVAIRQLSAGRIYNRDLLLGIVKEYGAAEMAGLPLPDDVSLLRQLRAVTPQDVRAAAIGYLQDGNLTIAEGMPPAGASRQHWGPKQSSVSTEMR
jgi:zinc protease